MLSEPPKTSHCMPWPFQQNKHIHVNFRDLLQISLFLWVHMFSHIMPLSLVNIPATSSSSFYWNNLLSAVLHPLLPLPQNTNQVFISDGRSFTKDKFSSFPSNIPPMLRNCPIYVSKHIYIHTLTCYTCPYIIIIRCYPGFFPFYKLIEGMVSTCHITS